MSNLPGMAYRCANNISWTMEFVSDGCKELTEYDPFDIIDNNKYSFSELIFPEEPGSDTMIETGSRLDFQIRLAICK